MGKCQNMVGPQVRRLRYVRGWSQEKLAEKLQLLGWDIGRVSLAKIECRVVRVDDYELLFFTKVFSVPLAELYPRIDPARRVHEVVAELMQRGVPLGTPPKNVATIGTVARAPRRWSG
jgi:transcriptional regulator with XRE-family HTH domain